MQITILKTYCIVEGSLDVVMLGLKALRISEIDFI